MASATLLTDIRRSAPKPRPVAYPSGLPGFAAWLRLRAPHLYKTARPSLAGLGFAAPTTPGGAATAATGQSTMDKLREMLLAASQVYLTREQVKAQQKVIDAQILRAQQGLPPLDINMAQMGIQPQVGVGVSSDTQKFILIGLGLAGAIYLLPKVFGR